MVIANNLRKFVRSGKYINLTKTLVLMNKLKFWGLIMPIAAITLLLNTQCKEKPEPEMAEPEIKMAVLEVTQNQARIELSIQNADNAAYLLSTGEEVPSADKILAEGTPVDIAEKIEIRLTELEAGTDYTVYAAASGKNKCISAKQGFTTAEEEFDGETIDATSAMGIYYGLKFSKNAANYYFMVTDCLFEDGKAMSEGSMIYFDCYSTASTTPENAVIPSGQYIYEDRVTHEQFRISNESTAVVRVGTNGQITDNIYFREGTLNVTSTEDGNYELEGIFTTKDGKKIRIRYSGKIEMGNQSGVYGKDITVTAKYAYADVIYYGDALEAGFSEYYFQVGDMEPDSEGKPLGSGYMLDFDLWGATSADSKNAVIPEGTYKFSRNIEINSLFADKTCGHCIIPDGTGKYSIEYTDGSVTVEHSADGYALSGYFVLEDGYKLNFTYNGKLEFKDMAPAVSEDINEQFTEGKGSYYGDLYGYGTANYSLEFSNADKSIVLTIDMNDILPSDGNPAISEGTYTLDEEEKAQAGKFYAGIIDMWGPVGTFCTINAEGQDPQYLLINGGTFTVSRQGENLDFTFDFTAQGGTSVKGSYSGSFPIE